MHGLMAVEKLQWGLAYVLSATNRQAASSEGHHQIYENTII